jgi:hypothetical protein
MINFLDYWFCTVMDCTTRFIVRVLQFVGNCLAVGGVVGLAVWIGFLIERGGV